MGCVGYRGYFDQAGADASAAELRAQGLEVDVYGVPAYSTLGWIDWLGGDPLLSTPSSTGPRASWRGWCSTSSRTRWPTPSDDTAFNESFATAVERIGGSRWLAQERAMRRRRASSSATTARREDFRALTLRYRDRAGSAVQRSRSRRRRQAPAQGRR